jgi:nitrate reductase gamma subunit
MKKEEHMRLSYTVQLGVLVMTALAGTGFAISLIFLFWELTDPYRAYLDRSLYYVGISGALTLVGLIILSLSKRSQDTQA